MVVPTTFSGTTGPTKDVGTTIKQIFVPAILIGTVVPTMTVGTGVSTWVIGTATKEAFVPAILVGTVVPTLIDGTAVPTTIVLTAYYWKSCNLDRHTRKVNKFQPHNSYKGH